MIKKVKQFYIANKKKIDIVLKVIFIICFITYLDLLIDVSVIKYTSLGEIFSPDRFRTRSVNFIPYAGYNVRFDSITNIIMYLPFGFLLQMAFEKKNNRIYLIIPTIFSIVVEILQYVLYLGATDITDVINNTIGGFIGIGLYFILNKLSKHKLRFHGIIYIFAVIATIICIISSLAAL